MHAAAFNHCIFRWKAKLIDGKAIAADIKAEVKEEVEKWMALGNRRPHLTAVIVGDDPASKTYVRNKMKASEASGTGPCHAYFRQTIVSWKYEFHGKNFKN